MQVSLLGILQLFFVVLKLTELIHWSWVVVFMPLIIVGIVIVIVLIVAIVITIIEG